ncbi:short-chain dehydrogenase/reductase [Streptomyces sp. CA-181903]|uniref:short-chain dehydrogenase/reductase n=1 Tax=Streptomyces sp. CA-181903 TaxID=3240055 RepID=UPI003D91002B
MARYRLTDRTVLITGATGGIGTAGARALHARGANVVLLGRDASALAALARELGAERALPLRADVTDQAALDEAVERAVHRFGGLDVVFANAGTAPTRPATLATIDAEVFERIVEVNVLGTWRTLRSALPHVIARRGHILVNASVYAYVNGAANAPYAASKAAVEQLVRALRVELGACGATAGVLYAGWVKTGMTRVAFGGDPLATRMREAAFPRPFARAITPDLVAARVVKGIEHRAAALTVPRRWQALGALRGIANPLVDRALIRHARLQALLWSLEDEGERPTRQPAPATGAGAGVDGR